MDGPHKFTKDSERDEEVCLKQALSQPESESMCSETSNDEIEIDSDPV